MDQEQKEVFRKRLSVLNTILHPMLPASASQTLIAFSVLAQAKLALELETTVPDVARFARLRPTTVRKGVETLIREGFLTKNAPRGTGPKFYKLELAAMEAAALRIRRENPDFSRLLEQTGIALPLPPVRKRKRPLAA